MLSHPSVVFSMRANKQLRSGKHKTGVIGAKCLKPQVNGIVVSVDVVLCDGSHSHETLVSHYTDESKIKHLRE